MEIRDWFLVTFTFFVGIFAGVYLYVTAYQPLYDAPEEDVDEARVSDLSIIGVQYGGFVPEDYQHPSFRISADGSYDYRTGGTGLTERRSGELPAGYFNEVRRAIARADLDAFAARAVNKNCVSYADGIEYEYSLEVEGSEYTLDTCLTQFENNSELGRVLAEMWRYAESPDTHQFNITISNDLDAYVDDEYNWWNPIDYLRKGFIEAGFEEEY